MMISRAALVSVSNREGKCFVLGGYFELGLVSDLGFSVSVRVDRGSLLLVAKNDHELTRNTTKHEPRKSKVKSQSPTKC